jgi:predicted metal-binding membrane protein
MLAVAGLFQFTPLKHACLIRCRSPWGAVLNPSSAITLDVCAAIVHPAATVALISLGQNLLERM